MKIKDLGSFLCSDAVLPKGHRIGLITAVQLRFVQKTANLRMAWSNALSQMSDRLAAILIKHESTE